MKKINPNILAILFAQIVCASVLAIGAPTNESTLQEFAYLIYMLLFTMALTALVMIISSKKK